MFLHRNRDAHTQLFKERLRQVSGGNDAAARVAKEWNIRWYLICMMLFTTIMMMFVTIMVCVRVCVYS